MQGEAPLAFQAWCLHTLCRLGQLIGLPHKQLMSTKLRANDCYCGEPCSHFPRLGAADFRGWPWSSVSAPASCSLEKLIMVSWCLDPRRTIVSSC